MSRPWQSRSEYLVDMAMQSALAASPDQLRAMRPAAVPSDPFPPRTGYQKQVASVTDVMNIDRYVPSRRTWISGIPSMPSVLSDYTWSGSSRNSMSGDWR